MDQHLTKHKQIMSNFTKNAQQLEEYIKRVDKYVSTPKYYEKSTGTTYVESDEYIVTLFGSSTKIDDISKLNTMVNGKFYTVDDNIYTFYKKEDVSVQTWSWLTFGYYDAVTSQVTELHSFTKIN